MGLYDGEWLELTFNFILRSMRFELLLAACAEVFPQVNISELPDVPHHPSLLHNLAQLLGRQLISVDLGEEVRVMPDTFGAIVEIVAWLGHSHNFGNPQVPINRHNQILGECCSAYGGSAYIWQFCLGLFFTNHPKIESWVKFLLFSAIFCYCCSLCSLLFFMISLLVGLKKSVMEWLSSMGWNSDYIIILIGDAKLHSKNRYPIPPS